MDMQVHETGSHHQAGDIDHLPACPGARALEVRSDSSHLTALDEDVGPDLAARGENATPRQDDPAHHLPPSRRNSMAIRTATPLVTWSRINARG